METDDKKRHKFIELAQDYFDRRTDTARERAFAHAESYVKQVIGHRLKFDASYQHYDDLVSEGLIGAHIAIDKYDPSRRVQFNIFAEAWVAGTIKHYLRDSAHMIRLPAWVQEAQRKGLPVEAPDPDCADIDSIDNSEYVAYHEDSYDLAYTDTQEWECILYALLMAQQGCSCNQIARMLGVSPYNMATVYYKKLREYIEHEGKYRDARTFDFDSYADEHCVDMRHRKLPARFYSESGHQSSRYMGTKLKRSTVVRKLLEGFLHDCHREADSSA